MGNQSSALDILLNRMKETGTISTSPKSTTTGTQYDWRGIPIQYSPDAVQSEATLKGLAAGAAGGASKSSSSNKVSSGIKDYTKRR